MSELEKQAHKLAAELDAVVAMLPNPIVRGLLDSIVERFHALLVEIINKVEKKQDG